MKWNTYFALFSYVSLIMLGAGFGIEFYDNLKLRIFWSIILGIGYLGLYFMIDSLENKLKGGYKKMEEQKSVGEWDSYISNFLKASDIESEDQAFVVISAEEVDNRGERVIRLQVENKEIKYSFDLNKTNAVFLKTEGKLKHPKDVVGKKLYFKKIMVRNPQLNKEVEGIRIHKVE